MTVDRHPLLSSTLSTRSCHLVSLFLVFLRLSFISTACGLSCVQCVSVESQSCLHGGMTSTPCVGADTGSTYCLKSVGTQVEGHGHFVFRTCSKTLQTNCTLTNMEGDKYNICHHSCAQDGCNRAASIRLSVLLLLVVCVFVKL